MPELPAISPRRAAVVPRAAVYPTGEPLPLEHHVQTLLSKNCRLAINLYGPPGSGKTAALNHLATIFPAEKLVLLDQSPDPAFIEQPHERLVLFTSESRVPQAPIGFELATWHEDDLIEYLLHTHRDKCKSVIQRIMTADEREGIGTLPELWTVVLEEFAADEQLHDVSEAFRRHLEKQLGERFHEACSHCLQSVLAEKGRRPKPAPMWNMNTPLLRHAPPLTVLAADRLAAEIGAGNFAGLRCRISREVIRQTARHFSPPHDNLRPLETEVEEDLRCQSTGATLMLAANPAWRPTTNRLRNLVHAQVDGALWKEIQLFDANLHWASFRRADLRQANLQAATAHQANFRQAGLHGADMRTIRAKDADFSLADLSQARCQSASFEGAQFELAMMEGANLDDAEMDRSVLTGARLAKASLRRTSFEDALIDGADFSHAEMAESYFLKVRFENVRLDGAVLAKARLLRCNLEGIDVPLANFEGADLSGSYLTASTMLDANFRTARLRNTGLAEVQWENADLRGADFRGATFHMGSSRSGLVNSPIPSEGSRTGFYTDDYYDQDYKPPEEIRKANLCGCDLRDAIVDTTDFYLVDLRRAKYSEEQGRHFARCGAILRSRC